VTEESDEIDRLVAAVVAGDKAALNQLLVILRPLVVRYCRSRLGTERSGVAADDVAQEVCLAVLKSLPTYTDQGKPFLAFVYGIAAHKVVDAHRSVARSRSEPVEDLPEELDPRDGPEQRAMNGALSVQMGQLLDTLPPKQREILVLRVVVGLSAEETAEAVESTPGAVRVAQHRALSKLRTQVSAMSEEVS
jgi:RNA polymerase sigma-70 factor, ECF subfamily